MAKIHEVFIDSIQFRLFSTSNYELLVFLYSLTLNGRAFVRKKFDFGSILEPDDIDVHELEETIIQLEVLKDMRQTIPETNQVEERP